MGESCPELPKGKLCPLCGGKYLCLQTWRRNGGGSMDQQKQRELDAEKRAKQSKEGWRQE